ncbi:MAG: histidine kinase internal subunit [Flaviaesturariibacter sp.]|nr:histidine kinase internal subunit [Flaviaesturariibacter sp.]
MTELFQKPSNATKTEFWAVTTLFVFFIFFYITDGLNGESALRSAHNLPFFEDAGLKFRFYKHYFIPQLIQHVFVFLAFLYLNLWVIPQLIKKQGIAKNIFIIILVYVAGGILFGITNTYLKGYLYTGARGRDAIDQDIFADSFLYAITLLWGLAIYTAMKCAALYLLRNTTAICERYPFLRPEGLAAIVIWMIGLLLLGFGGVEMDSIATWLIIVPSAIAVYLLSFYKFISKALHKKHPFTTYFLRHVFIMPVLFLLGLFILTVTTGNEDMAADFAFLNVVFQLLITVPLSWVLFKRFQKGNEEMFVLKKELKQSTANIDFLRSQINPHFLFNALNTIYGTAIQEGAERTSEGIEKLGDMMRFMLQENLQEKISLAREIDYLNNYISLQKLRTDTSPEIQIVTEIHNRENIFQIAPMLLIPFVENAFKHGISFREPSHIKVTLEIKNNTLYFDVYNSKHPKMENDPEKDKSGVGLENVKQRLKLVYPNRHELMIRETSKEFFIHLTIQLA